MVVWEFSTLDHASIAIWKLTSLCTSRNDLLTLYFKKWSFSYLFPGFFSFAPIRGHWAHPYQLQWKTRIYEIVLHSLTHRVASTWNWNNPRQTLLLYKQFGNRLLSGETRSSCDRWSHLLIPSWNTHFILNTLFFFSFIRLLVSFSCPHHYVYVLPVNFFLMLLLRCCPCKVETLLSRL